MQIKVRVFEVQNDPATKPQEQKGFAIEAVSLDAARSVAKKRLFVDGRIVRSISHEAGGGLVAYVYRD